MTYTVLALCRQSGRIGIGITTYSIAVGQFCAQGLRRGMGATLTQANVRHQNNRIAMGLLSRGFGPDYVLEQLQKDDPHHESRQIAALTHDGRIAAHTGTRARPWAGHQAGDGFIVLGNGLAGPQVLEAMHDGFNADPQLHLADRLIASLEAGRDAGGQAASGRPVPERSAAVQVFDRQDFAEFDLRVDLHDSAVQELRRIFTAYRPHQPYYLQRSVDPSKAPSLAEFEAGLHPAGTLSTAPQKELAE